MAGKKNKNHWYVLVMSESGAVFVTKVNYRDKTAEWNEKEKPIEFGMETAKDLALGLSMNFHTAYPLCVHYEIPAQPYRYDIGSFEWVWDKDKDKKESEE